jgi:hypothetical protein
MLRGQYRQVMQKSNHVPAALPEADLAFLPMNRDAAHVEVARGGAWPALSVRAAPGP